MSLINLNNEYIKMTIKVLYVSHRSACNKYFHIIMSKLKKYSEYDINIITLSNYLKRDYDNFDIIIYQTWPDDKMYKILGSKYIPITDPDLYKNRRVGVYYKFPLDLIEKTDKKFLKSKIKHKILFDAYDEGNMNAFSRFENKKYIWKDKKTMRNLLEKIDVITIPRIKNSPHCDYLKKYNVIQGITFPTLYRKVAIDFAKVRTNFGHYYASLAAHPIRKKVFNILKKYNGTKVCIDKIPRDKYDNFLLDTKVSIAVPGCGALTFRHLDSLSNGCLLLAYENIQNYQILPNLKLIDGQDYLTFNLDNLHDKLKYIEENPDEIDKIRINGHKKFIIGYNIDGVAYYFNKKLKKLIS